MWRAMFLALGAYVVILGAEAMFLERAIVKPQFVGQEKLIKSEQIVPPDWAPWSLMGAGAVTVLYSFTIPQRVKS